MVERGEPRCSHRTARALALAGVCVLLAGACRRETSDTAAAGEADGPRASYPGRPLPLPAGAEELRARFRPDEAWPLEQLAYELAGPLQGLLEAGLGSPPSETPLAVAQDARLAPLLPGAPRVVRERDGLRVLAWADAAVGADDALAEPEDALAPLRERLGAGSLRVATWLMRVEERGPDAFRTQLLLRAWNEPEAEAAARVQVDAELSVDVLRREDRLLLQAWSVASAVEVRADRMLFRELTRAVLPREASIERELFRGAGDYLYRWDQNGGLAVVGMHGLSVSDVNGDGRDDLYMVQPGTQRNRLFLQRADGRLEDFTEPSGTGILDNVRSALLCDFDDDGDQDLAVGAGPHVILAYNEGDARFPRSQVLRYTGEGTTEVYCMAAADPDGDGDLDLYVGRYDENGLAGGVPTPYYDARNGASNYYWRQMPGQRWELATEDVGLDRGNTRFTLAAQFHDVDVDGDVDLYVVNDFGRNNLYLNDGSGRFTDVGEERGALDVAAGMGVTVADVDLDGDQDLYISNMFSAPGSRLARQEPFLARQGELSGDYARHCRGNTLLFAEGGGAFRDGTPTASLAPGGWAWGAMFLDFDNDALSDLVVPNGFITGEAPDRPGPADDWESFFWREVVARSPLEGGAAGPAMEAYERGWAALRYFTVFETGTWNGHERNYGYLNVGGGRFVDASAVSGLHVPDDGRSACVTDWDGDGRQDLWLRNRNAPRLRFLQNDSPGTNPWLALRLVGTVDNRDAIGARVTVELVGRRLERHLFANEGHLGQSTRALHFGLGALGADETSVRALEVTWPGGDVERFEDVAPGRTYRVVQGRGTLEALPPRGGVDLAGLDAEVLDLAPDRAHRVTLSAKLPMAGLPVDLGPERPKRLSGYAGAPLVLVLWDSSDPAVRAETRTLAALAGTGARVLAFDGAEEAGPDGTRVLERAGIEGAFAPSSRRFEKSLEPLLVEVLGPFEDLPLPLAFVLDRGANLVTLQIGALEAEDLARDLAIIAKMDPDSPSTQPLTGGRWVAQRGRNLRALQAVFRNLGFRELASYYRSLIE